MGNDTMTYHRGLLFWGLALITGGAVALAAQQGYIDQDLLAGAWRLWPLVLCLVASVLGYGLCATVTTPWMLMAIAFFLLGLASASYTLLFAIAKAYLDGRDAPTRSRGMAALRMIS